MIIDQVVRPVDELFKREELSATPDSGWPDMFDTHVLVLRPSAITYESLSASIRRALQERTEQDLLTSAFKEPSSNATMVSRSIMIASSREDYKEAWGVYVRVLVNCIFVNVMHNCPIRKQHTLVATRPNISDRRKLTENRLMSCDRLTTATF